MAKKEVSTSGSGKVKTEKPTTAKPKPGKVTKPDKEEEEPVEKDEEDDDTIEDEEDDDKIVDEDDDDDTIVDEDDDTIVDEDDDGTIVKKKKKKDQPAVTAEDLAALEPAVSREPSWVLQTEPSAYFSKWRRACPSMPASMA
jgi:hypothetical protein